MKRIATLAVVAAAALAGTAGTAEAATHGPFQTKADCVHWAGVYEMHGYIISRGCYGSYGNWRFTTR